MIFQSKDTENSDLYISEIFIIKIYITPPYPQVWQMFFNDTLIITILSPIVYMSYQQYFIVNYNKLFYIIFLQDNLYLSILYYI